MKSYHLANPLMRGTPHGDLEPLQKALKAAKLYLGPVDDVFGAGTGHACKAAWYRLGAPLKSCTPHGDQDLLNLLRGTTKIPPLWVVRRHARGYGLTAADRQRRKIVDYALWAALNSASIHYAQVRPMDHLNQVERLPWTTDCSEFVTTVYRWAGAPDPNGMRFNGYGWTGTMFDNGEAIPLYQVKPGDVVLWGYAPGHHTAVFVQGGAASRDPMIVSHGSERGPLHIPLSAENAAQSGRPMTFKTYIRG